MNVEQREANHKQLLEQIEKNKVRFFIFKYKRNFMDFPEENFCLKLKIKAHFMRLCLLI